MVAQVWFRWKTLCSGDHDLVLDLEEVLSGLGVDGHVTLLGFWVGKILRGVSAAALFVIIAVA